MRIISFSLVIIAMAFGSVGCQGVASSKSEPNQAVNSSEKSSSAQADFATKTSRTYTDEEKEMYHSQKDEWRDMLEGLDRDTVNKPKKDLVTPSGVKRVYDPYQDSVVKMVFDKLYKERQQSDCFDDWPDEAIDRSQRLKVKEHHFHGEDVYSPAARILRKARAAQQNDYIRAGCRWPETLRCLNREDVRPFTICSLGPDAAWGSSVLSDCETPNYRGGSDVEAITLSHGAKGRVPNLCYYTEDLPSVSRPDGYEDRYLPFHGRHIGDPVRGTVEQQFEQYFAINCSKFQNVQSQ